MNDYDFEGYATRNNVKCSDGRTIMKDAFKANDGQTVPLVWNHQHAEVSNVLGHALLENREDGVYAYGKFNDTADGQNAKILVRSGDIKALSIYANQLKEQGKNVIHGAIREVSLVLAGANPGAFIQSVISHGDNSDEEVIMYFDQEISSLSHAEENQPDDLELEHSEKQKEDTSMADTKKPEDAKKPEDTKKPEEKTAQEVFETLNDEQKTLFYALVGQALQEPESTTENEPETKKTDEGASEVKHNAFDTTEENTEKNVLTHSQEETIISDARTHGSLKQAFLSHADYGVENIDYLFPEAKATTNVPEFIQRDTSWVSTVMNGIHNVPFSRIKSMFANITEDEARARGYIKGNLKKEEVFSLLKRTTTPCTVYKKQKLDRDDIIDIVDFDVVAWIKTEMRVMLDEEIARSILVGDGRLASDEDKINETCIRPIWTDEDLYAIKTQVLVAANATDDDKAKAMIKMAVKARKGYKGSGNPVFFTTEDYLTDALLLEDSQGYRLYKSAAELATAMRVSNIVTVPVMEGLTRTVDTKTHTLMGIIVNLNDYEVGADKGGAVNMFDDFDIDFNQQKYLIETRCSGALVRPYSAIVLEMVVSA